MPINRLICYATLAAGLAAAGPALAGEPPMTGASYTQAASSPAAPMTPAPAMAGPSREAWLAECRRRSAPVDVNGGWAGWDDDRHDRRHRGHEHMQSRSVSGLGSGGNDACASYLAEYEAWAATVSAGYARQAAYSTAAPANTGCCQPRPRCGETVEYVEEYVPARRVARPPRDKRIRLVPDKRVRVP